MRILTRYLLSEVLSHALIGVAVFTFVIFLRDLERILEVVVRNSAPLPIAGGEVLTRRQSFTPWLQQGAFDIVQLDVTKVGGISEERRIAWMAEECGVRFVPHGWNTALGLAADLHLAAASPRTDLVEYLTGSPFVDDLAANRWRLDADGMLSVPNTPGLGVALDMDAVEKYTGIQFGD